MLLYVVLLLLLLLLLLVKLKICVTFLNNFAAYRTANWVCVCLITCSLDPSAAAGSGAGPGTESQSVMHRFPHISAAGCILIWRIFMVIYLS